MTSPVPPVPEEGVPVTLWRYATTDHHGYDVSGWTDRDGGTGVAYRALPVAAYNALLARANTAKVLLKEARRYVEDNIAGRFVPSNGDAATLLSRIDAALGEG